jgi:hypothetical protein
MWNSDCNSGNGEGLNLNLAFHKTTWMPYVVYCWRETDHVVQHTYLRKFEWCFGKIFPVQLSKYVSPVKGYCSAVFQYFDVKWRTVSDLIVIDVKNCFLPPPRESNYTRICLKRRATLNYKLSLESYFKIKVSRSHNMIIILSTPSNEILDNFKLLQK